MEHYQLILIMSICVLIVDFILFLMTKLGIPARKKVSEYSKEKVKKAQLSLRRGITTLRYWFYFQSIFMILPISSSIIFWETNYRLLFLSISLLHFSILVAICCTRAYLQYLKELNTELLGG